MLDEDFEIARVEVDLDAIRRNWMLLKSTHAGQDCGAVVKANAYGLGVEMISAMLADVGCQHFFVATLEEGIQLRQLLTSQFIYVFNGVQAGEETGFLDYNLLPVLNNWQQFERWEKAVGNIQAAGSVLHVDTGINRLGFSQDEAEKLAMEPERLRKAQVRLLMSHLACGAEPEHPLNKIQLERFAHIRKCFPTLSASLSNSAGIFMHKHYHHDLGRPGCALYGINPYQDRPNPMEPVATLTAPVIQCYSPSEAESTVGYGALVKVSRDTRLATVAMGYADGIPRILGDKGGSVWFGDYEAPIIGRISMDLITLDVTAVPEQLTLPGQRCTFIGAQQDVNALAAKVDTIGYEIFTSLKARIQRVYTGNYGTGVQGAE